jgi:hypothetical protein
MSETSGDSSETVLFEQLPPRLRRWGWLRGGLQPDDVPGVGLGAFSLLLLLAVVAGSRGWAWLPLSTGLIGLGGWLVIRESRRTRDVVSSRAVVWRRGLTGRADRQIPIGELTHVVSGPSSIPGEGSLSDLYFHSATTLICFLGVEGPQRVERALRDADWTGEWRPRT